MTEDGDPVTEDVEDVENAEDAEDESFLLFADFAKSPYKPGRSKRYPPFINHFWERLPANMGQKGRVGRGLFIS